MAQPQTNDDVERTVEANLYIFKENFQLISAQLSELTSRTSLPRGHGPEGPGCQNQGSSVY